MFSITSARDFFNKVTDDLALVQMDNANVSCALNCMLSSYHLHEWVWAKWLKPLTPRQIDGTIIRSQQDFIAWLETHCPHFNLIQDLANGSKHCRAVAQVTERIEGYGAGPFGVGPLSEAYLLVDMGAGR